MRKFLRAVVMLTLLMVAMVMCVAALPDAPEGPPDPSRAAATMCRDHIEAMLVSPATADHPFLDVVIVPIPDAQGRPAFQVQSYVDSQNRMGAILRTHYRCSLALDDPERPYNGASWTLLEFVTE